MLEISTLTKENCPPLNNVNVPSKRAQWYSPCKNSLIRKPLSPESDVPSLTLNHFSKIPKISFGNVKVGESKTEPFIVLNPHPTSQVLTLEKCPQNTGFSVERSEYGSVGDSGKLSVIVPPNEEVFLSIKWEPKENGSYRELIRFMWDNCHRLQVVVFGKAVVPHKVRPPKSNVKCEVGKKITEPVLQQSQVPNTCEHGSFAESFDSSRNIIFGSGDLPNRRNQVEEDLRRETFVVKSHLLQINKKSVPSTGKKSSTPTMVTKAKKYALRQNRNKFSPTSGAIQRKPKLKVKLKSVAKGVPQRKLQLIKTSKSSLPRHPMPFAAKNMYYDERWMQKQQEGFTRWLNFVLTPVEEPVPATQDSRKGAIALREANEVKKCQPLAPTREVLSLRVYTARRKMARLRQSACLLYQSEPLIYIIRRVEAEVENGRLAIRPDKKLHADLGIKQQVIDILLSYNTLWLRIGLETIYGEILPIYSNNDVAGLTRFINDRLLGNPDVAKMFSHPQVPGLYRKGYEDRLGKFTLKKFLLLVLFLDRAKLTRLVDHDPCLFNKDAVFKSSRSLLLSFSREYLKGEGDVTKHLNFLGYAVTHSQKAIDEVVYAVKNLATDLRDGLRLTRVVELLTRDWQLSERLRVPAISRLQKIHNVEVFMDALKARNILFGGENGIVIDARHIVDGHREKTLALLWRIIFNFQVNVLLSKKQLQEEITHLENSTRLRAQASQGWIEEDDLKTSRRDSTELYCESDLLRLLLKWCKIVCRLYGSKIENFTVSFSDGRALCYLLHHYHPTLLPLSMIKQRTTLTCNPGVHDESDSEGEGTESWSLWTASVSPGSGKNALLEELKTNERENFCVLGEKVQELGGVPLMPKTSDMSSTIPDEKVVITYVAYLCARLLDLREETKAARCIQMAWRRHWFQRQLRRRENIRNVIVAVQAQARAALCRRRFRTLKQAAILIQSVYRGRLTRKELQVRHRAAACIQSRYHAYKQGQRVLEWFTNLKRTAVRLQCLVRSNYSERLKRRVRAATLVQATWRGHHARRLFNQQRAACVKVQCFVRGAVELKRFQRLKQATLVLQRWYRALFGARILRKRFLHMRSCVVKVQSLFRGRRDRKLARRMRATIKLQSHARAWHTRRRFLHLKEVTIKIQAHVRKCQAEQRYARLKRAVKLLQVRVRARLHGRKQRLEYQKMKHASVKIQSLVRGYITRNEFMRSKKAAVVIQTEVRKYLLQKTYQSLVSSTLLIQARFREYLHTKTAMETFLRMKRSAVKIQSLYRGYQCRERMKRVKRAAITIQSHARRHQSRKKFLAIKCAALLVQVRYRALLDGRQQRKDYQRLLLGFTRLQAITRGNTVRMQVRNQRDAATVIQAWVRRYLAAKRFHDLKESAIMIQRHIRRVSANRRVALRCTSAARIQAAYRGYRARMLFKVLKAVVVLQSAARGWKVRKNLERQHKMASLIQAVYRAHVARQRYLSLWRAVLLIQRRYRALRQGREVRSRFKRALSAAVKIQSYVRFCQSKKRHRCATKIQAAYRGHAARKSFRTFYVSVVRCQAIARGYLVRKHLAALKVVAILLQTRYRARVIGMRQYLNYHVQRGACIVLQAVVRGFICMKRYQVIRNATIDLQQRYRAKVIGGSQRRCFLETKAAAIRLQACARGWRDRKVTRKLKAARLIEATYKMHKTRQEYLAYRRAVIIIQAQSRMVRQRRRFEELKKATMALQRRRRATTLCKRDQLMFHLTRGAVITLQMAVKGYLVRARLRKMSIAAVRIQAHVRGLLERKRYAVTKRAVLVLQLRCRAWLLGRALAENYRTLKASAVVIQSCYRSYRLRCLRRLHKAAVTIQAAFRRHTCRAAFLARKTSVVMIQAAVKCYLARQSYLKLRCATVFIQQRLRAQKKMQEARQHYILERNACIAVQSCVRGWLRRRRYIALKTAVVSIQQYHRACVEARKQRRYFLKLRSAAVGLQSYFRMHLASTSYKRTRNAITKIQAASRMRTVRERYRSLKALTITLQRRYRAKQICKRQLAHYQRTRMSVVVIQAHYRGFKAREMVKTMAMERERQQAAAIKIQRYYLSWRLMKEVYFAYHLTRGAIITIQSAHRMRMAQRFVRKLRATEKIKAFCRGTIARRNYVKLRQAVCKLQSMVRRKRARRQFKRILEAAIVVQQRYRAQRAMKKNREDYSCLRQATVVVQSQFRRQRQRQSYLAVRRKIVRLQAMVRMRLQRTTFLRERSAAIAIQRYYRWYIADKVIRERSIEMRRAAVKLQACFRGFQARRKATQIKSAILIQATFRRFMKRRAYLHTRRVVVNMQALTRRRRCFKQYRSLKSVCIILQRRVRANNAARNARQDFVVLRRAVIKLQSCYRGWKARSGLREVYAARRIQRCYRAILQGRRARREYRKTPEATLIVQAAYRGYCGRLRARETRAARIIQAAVRGFIARRNIKRFHAARHAQLVRFTAAVYHHVCAVRIQRYFRRGRAMALAKARMECVLFIQFWWRGALQRQRFTRLRRAAMVIQREARKKLENKHRKAARIQALIRGVLVRGRLNKMQDSALRIQANWRGFLVRRNTTTVKVKIARRRIESANAAACESMKLRNRTRSALDFLLRCKNISRILEALVNLEVVTRLSWVCCEQVVGDGALRVIFKVIRKCNRSLPHIEVIKYSISIMLNVSKCPYLYRAVYDEPRSVDTLVELLTNFRDKAAIFSTTCRLLAVLCRDSAISEDLLIKTKTVDSIRTIHSLVERKYKLETKRNTMKSMTERSACPRPNATPCKHTPHKAKTANGLQWKEPVDVVGNPLEAVRSLVRCLDL